MRFHMINICKRLREMNPIYRFEPVMYLNLIMIYKLGNNVMNSMLTPDTENSLSFSDDGVVTLVKKTSNQDMIKILNQARSMLDDFNR